MHVAHKQLSVLDVAPAVLQVDRALADGLYLSAEQLQPSFEGFLHEIIVKRFFVGGDGSAVLFFHSYLTFPSVQSCKCLRKNRLYTLCISFTIITHPKEKYKKYFPPVPSFFPQKALPSKESTENPRRLFSVGNFRGEKESQPAGTALSLLPS